MTWLSIYNIAASISTPLALGGLVTAFFFYIVSKIIDKISIPLKNFTGEYAYKILRQILFYGFALAVIALFGGLLSYGLQFLIEKQVLVEQAKAYISNRDPEKALEVANKIITKAPGQISGYNLRGTANFQLRNFMDAAGDFRKVIEITNGGEVCASQNRVYAIVDLAASLTAGGDASTAFDRMKSIENCKLDKTDKFNFGKIAMMNDDFGRARKYLLDRDLTDKSRPDLRYKVYVELAVLEILERGNDWQEHAISHFRNALCLDGSIKPLIFNTYPGDKADLPGAMVQEYGFEISIMKKPENRDFQDHLIATVKDQEVCDKLT